MKGVLNWIAVILVIFAALDVGLVGISNGFELVNAIFGSMPIIARIIFIIIGIAGIYDIYLVAKK